MINYEDFQKLDLRVAKVLEVERVKGSEKLLKLKLDDGEATLPAGRQVVAGIGKVYAPEDLIGKEIIIIVNLEPRSLMGIESNGMVLAGHGENGEAIILQPEREVPPGSKIS
ncbi:methionine--tRNA ligase subunit beta [Candidatus Wolfebacteria bacterium CG10_big_fil_rev_8_21_14_0_10_31_9]|uniref:Methionine--tRNA ligase n=1 Tax=Candidatus Wolfebacteria bacterium CG10_big_fil_rev_8_21_14_0_10_31_9 TaxID=1975070 RepID=A0A2H0RCC2_9BACT|nr:MAG: methionine--tRNA ligase subunit beta [Candidatus Wolfebacteria bacterium CG10_big_fil_rev_8_21_14_0_10_31_9]